MYFTQKERYSFVLEEIKPTVSVHGDDIVAETFQCSQINCVYAAEVICIDDVIR